MIIRINPLDTFFFRDGKPFEMGDEAWADGIFPPSPSVIYGALRSLWISQQEGGFTEENISNSKELRINGIFLELYNQTDANEKEKEKGNWKLYYPVPKDFVELNGRFKKDNTKGILELEKFVGISNYTFQHIATKKTNKKLQIENYSNLSIFKDNDFQEYTKGNEKVKPISTSYITKEAKIGIARNSQTNTSEEGKLYRVEMQRFGDFQFSANRNKNLNPENMRLVVDFDMPFEEQSTFIKLGGEGKTASVIIENSTLEKIPFPKLITKDNKTFFKVCFLTPCIFGQGLLPSWIDKSTMKSKIAFSNLSLELLTVVTDKPISIGGFDMQATNANGSKGMPKPMQKMIPTSSVYYFSCDGTGEEINKEIEKLFHYQNISEDLDNSTNYACEGFGLSIVANPKINL